MELKAEFVKYERDADERPIKKNATLVKISSYSKSLHEGCIIFIKELTFVPTSGLFRDETFLLSRPLGTSKLSLQTYSGYDSGRHTLLDFNCESSDFQISTTELLSGLTRFFGQEEGNRFSIDSCYIVDGWLEVSSIG